MLKKLLLLALLVLSFNAYASEREQSNGNVTNIGVATTSKSIAGAMALSGSTAYSSGGAAMTGNNNISVDNGNDRIIPASSAIAPSQYVNNDCQIATPQSKAVSILIASFSGTTGVIYNDLCYAYKRGQFDVSDRLMCLKSKDYAQANPACSK